MGGLGSKHDFFNCSFFDNDTTNKINVKNKTDPDNRETLKVTFDAFPELYHQMRPLYPQPLIEDVIKLSGISNRGKILEIGCGTGKATEQFASLGYHIIGLDIGNDLAAVAARNLAKYENVTIQITSYEDWDPADKRFDLVMAATSFHWVDPDVRLHKTANVLNPSGALAVFWNNHIGFEEGFTDAVRPLYRKCAPSMLRNTLEDDRLKMKEPGAELFQPPAHRSYHWNLEYSSEDYIKLLNTYSPHIQLPDSERAHLHSEIKNIIDEKFGGRILKHYETVLELRKSNSAQ